MCVHNSAPKVFKAFEIGHVGSIKMARRHNNIVEFLWGLILIGIHVLVVDCKLLCVLVVGHQFDSGVSFDPVWALEFVKSGENIFEARFSGREGPNWLAEMVHEGVVGVLQNFFWGVREKLLIHTWVDRLAELIETSSPSVVPESTMCRLLFKTGDLGDVLASLLCLCECCHLRHATWTCSNDGQFCIFDTLIHWFHLSLSLIFL